MLNPIFAQTNGFAAYADSAHKLLSANRDFYRLMSEMTVGGRVPTAEEVKERMNGRYQPKQD